MKDFFNNVKTSATETFKQAFNAIKNIFFSSSMKKAEEERNRSFFGKIINSLVNATITFVTVIITPLLMLVNFGFKVAAKLGKKISNDTNGFVSFVCVMLTVLALFSAVLALITLVPFKLIFLGCFAFELYKNFK